MTVHDLVSALPEPADLLARCRALALLDSVVADRWAMYTFQAEWRDGVGLAWMENGSGDSYGIVFDPAGVFLFGIDHECPATPWREEPRAHWPGLLDGLPAALARYPTLPELQLEGFFDATICVWRETGAAAWQCGPVAFGADESDGADWLFELLTADGPEAYAEYAEDMYKRRLAPEDVGAVLAGEPLTRRLVAALSDTADFEAVAVQARALGHPVQDVPMS
ncbi:hypothetical protein [Streptomyces sp. UNOC14_S4]|uniref:hypothetical protein n=1 Tax=Streptomyces sp. UNOC14_S4 TaxID=2872340 RepID=UPI001E2E13DF|nr:hypothetical protein [Streptomyces sp. UNOC14_S4]MCC3769416.1 hypothetical protein [Streptomyces sp. UNOC14_S4]